MMKLATLVGSLLLVVSASAAEISDQEIKTQYVECQTHGVAMTTPIKSIYKPEYSGCATIDAEYKRRDLESKQRLIDAQRLNAIKALSDKIKGN